MAEIVLLKVEFSKVSDAVRTGNLDTLDIYSDELLRGQSLESKGWRKTVTALGFENFILLDPKKYGKSIRSALVSALDQEKLVKDLGLKWLRPAYGMIPYFLPGAVPGKMHDPSSAKTVKGSVILEFSEQSKFQGVVAANIAKLWEAIGLKVTLRPLPIDVYLDHLFFKKAGAILASKGIDYPDGYSNLAYFRSDVSANYFFVENSSQDAAIRNLPYVPESARADQYLDIQRHLLKQNTFIPLFFGNSYSGLWSERVKFVPEHPLGFHFLDIEEVELK